MQTNKTTGKIRFLTYSAVIAALYIVLTYLAQLVGCSALTYLPAFVSVLISIVCLFFLLHKGKQKMSRWMIAGYALVTLLGYDLSLYIANWLDDFIRINW